MYQTIRKKLNKLINKEIKMNENTNYVEGLNAMPEQSSTRLFATPEEYKKVTGRRFRLTAEQKQDVNSGKITRQEAFDARYTELEELYQKSQNN